MDRLRTPFFIVALILIFLVVITEIGVALPGVGILRSTPTPAISVNNTQINDAYQGLSAEDKNMVNQLGNGDRPPGLGVPSLAFLDGILLFTVALMGVALILSERLQGRVQGIATLIFSLLLVIIAIIQILITFALLLLMISLLLSVPFGTIVYLVIYGSFNRSGAYITLSLLLLLKFAASGSLFFAQQRFLQSKGLVLLVLTSLLGNVIVGFLLGIVPTFLASITDAIAALIIGIIAVIWGIILFISSLVSIVKVLRVDRMLKA